MSDTDNGSKESRLIENDIDWQRSIIKHAIAWIALAIITIAVWKMAGPILNPGGTGESTSTASTISEGNPGSVDAISLPSGENRVQVIVASLDVREKAEEGSTKIGTLSKGTIVQAVGVEGKWVKIKTVDNKIGYISASSDCVRKAP